MDISASRTLNLIWFFFLESAGLDFCHVNMGLTVRVDLYQTERERLEADRMERQFLERERMRIEYERRREQERIMREREELRRQQEQLRYEQDRRPFKRPYDMEGR